MAKGPEVVYDKIGQEIRVGSIVAAPNSRTDLRICRVTRIMPKQLRCEDIHSPGQRYGSFWNKYHNEIIGLDEMDQTIMYLLSRGLDVNPDGS